MLIRPVLVSCFALFLTTASVVPVLAQSETATLSGRIADPQGASVPKAQVQIVNIDTNVASSTATNNEGVYVFASVKPGRYRILILKEGFHEIIRPELVLHVQDHIEQNFGLRVGSVSETVTVNGSDIQINTENAGVSTTVDRQFVSHLPLNGRSFQSLLLLSPGVVATDSGSGMTGEFSVNGQRSNTNYFTVDGVSANTAVGTSNDSSVWTQRAGGALPGLTALGTTASLVSVDALEEFKIQTSTYSAEFGRQPGAQVQLVTRSGSNQFHGTAFEYLRNDALDAQDWFNGSTAALFAQQGLKFQKPELRQNQFGGTFSGPIVVPKLYNGHDKTFFFFSYEGQRLRIPVFSYNTQYVPALWLRQAAAPALRPLLDAYPMPTGPEAQTLEHPWDLYDPVNNPYVPSGFASISTGYSNPSSVDAYSIRVDHTIGSKMRLFGRYAQTPSSSLQRNLNQLSGIVSGSRTLTLGSTESFAPQLNNEFRFNYSSGTTRNTNSEDNFGGAVPATLDQYLSPYNGPGPKNGGVSIGFDVLGAPAMTVGDYAANSQRQLSFVDNLMWAKGRHQLKFGVDWRREAPIFGPNAYSNTTIIYFPSGPPNYADFIHNITSGAADLVYLQTFRGAKPIYDNYSTYTEDAWRITPRLTLDLGFRWEINPAPHSADGVKPIMITGITGTDVSHSTLALNAPFYKTFYTAFGPRVGLAYQLNRRSGRETVVRGGFGVFYDLGSNLASAGFSQYPFSASISLYSVSLPLSPAQSQPPPFPADPSQVTLPLHEGPLYALNPNLKLPYTLQWNVALEKALGNQQTVTLSYVASAARRLTVTQYLNGVPDNAVYGGNINQYRANPNFDAILYVRNAPTSDYESLQAQYQRRLSRGLQALVNYTWSHAIDQVSWDFDQFTTLDRSSASFDVRHNFSAAVTYDLPMVRGTGPLAEPVARFVKAVANGWSLDSIFFARTGLPLDVTFDTRVLPDGNAITLRPDVVPGAPLWIKDPTVPGGEKVNSNAFTYPAYTVAYPYPWCPTCAVNIYQQGTEARNSVRLPGIYQIDLGVRRQFNLTDRVNFQLKAEAFSVLNHPLFGGYVGQWSPTNPSFGSPSSTLSNWTGSSGGLNSLYEIGGPRSIQLSLKLNF